MKSYRLALITFGLTFFATRHIYNVPEQPCEPELPKTAIVQAHNRENSRPYAEHIGMVHDYIFTNATRGCEQHSGLHYIVSVSTIFSKGDKNHPYPCRDYYKFRCQDGTLLDFDDGVGYCFISEEQLQESLGK